MNASKTLVVLLVVLVTLAALGAVITLTHNSDEGTNDEIDQPEPPENVTNNTVDLFTPNKSDTEYPGQLVAESVDFTGFHEVSDDVGLDYGPGDRRAVFGIMQGGVYVLDYNNNGYEDLLVLGERRPVLFANTGDGYERNRTFAVNATAAHIFDHDNSGERDIIFAQPGDSLVLYQNDGGAFTPRSIPVETPPPHPTITSADFTGNNCLDLYIGSWAGTDPQPVMEIAEFVEIGETHPDRRPSSETGGENILLAGTCGGFDDITETTGVGGTDWTLAVSAADFTGNGHIDMHVGNDFTADFIYENNGNGTFTQIDMGPESDRNAMSSTTADLTGNHHLDIFVTNVYFTGEFMPGDVVPVLDVAVPKGNNLFANHGEGEFVDIAPEHGLERGGWGWASTIADYTNDGHLDIIHASTYITSPVVDQQPEIFATPQVWKGTGESWEKRDGGALGFDRHNLRGVARVDYNRDGSLDFVGVENPTRALPAEPGENRTVLYENQLESDEFLQLWVRNPNGLDRNAGIYIETDKRTIYRENNARSDFLSQDSRLIHIGLKNEMVERVVVEWPDGSATTYETLETSNRYVLTPDGTERID